MIILVIDQTAEGQTQIARTIEGFDATDRDALDIHVSLANQQNYTARVAESDVMILGAGLGDEARGVARRAKELNPDIEIIMFVSQKWYSSEAFREALTARVRKVIPDSASPLDLLQELVSIHAQFSLIGRTKKGKLVVVMQAKGGLGATSFIAALAELANEYGKQTLLWDLDIESSDLSRGLNAHGTQSQLVTEWINGARDLSRETLKESLIPVGNYISLLTPPHEIAAGMDLLGHPDSIRMIHRVVELARVTQDTIIVDTAGKFGPATGTLLRLADEVLVLIDDSLLGLSAAHAFLERILPLTRNSAHSVRIVCAGIKLPINEIKEVLADLALPEVSWSLPPVPMDTAAAQWAGTGKTLYSLGTKNTKRVLEQFATELGIMHPFQRPRDAALHHEGLGWFKMMFQRASNAS